MAPHIEDNGKHWIENEKQIDTERYIYIGKMDVNYFNVYKSTEAKNKSRYATFHLIDKNDLHIEITGIYHTTHSVTIYIF